MIYVITKVRDGNTRRLGMFPTREQAQSYAEHLTDIYTGMFKLIRNSDIEMTYALNGDINSDIITIIQTDNE